MQILKNVKIRKIRNEYQIRYENKTPGIEKLNAFIFQVDRHGLHLFLLAGTVVAQHYLIDLNDQAALSSLHTQQVMRVEEVRANQQVYAMLMVNQNLITESLILENETQRSA